MPRRLPRRSRPALLLVPLAALAMGGCGGGAAGATELRSQVQREQVAASDAAALPEALAATDALGLKLLDATQPDSNTVTSPASLGIALAMAAEGARGRTAEELASVLGVDGPARSTAYNALLSALAKYDVKNLGDLKPLKEHKIPDQPLLHLANNAVVDDQASILPAYLDALARSYGAGMQQADLGSAAGKEVLDRWVVDNTGGLIEKSAIEPDPALRLVLQNAVVLAARWAMPFSPEGTSDRPFTTAAGERVSVPTMSATLSPGYAASNGWQAVRLLFTGQQMYADLLLPPPGAAPGDLSAETLRALETTLATGPASMVDLRLPKVALTVKTDLMPVLATLTPSLLEDRADLSGMSEERLQVGQAVQQATLTMDEAGTIAAAVTELGLRATGAAQTPRELSFDRPYVVRLGVALPGAPGAAAQAGATLFLARIADPRS